jgi:hypothetical protein
VSIVAARVRSRAGQLAAIALTAAVLAGVGVGMAGVLESGLDAAVRAAAEEPRARMLVASATADEVAENAPTAFGAAPVIVDDDVDGVVVLRPDPARAGTGDLTGYRDGAAVLAEVLSDEGVTSRTAVSGELGAWAGELLDLGWRSRLLALVPFLVVAVGGLVAARDVVRVLALSRVTELSVTRSRGASRRRLVLGELREVAAVGVAGAIVGGVVADLVAGTPVLLALGLIVIVPLALSLVAVPVVLSAIPRDRADEAAASSGRTRAAGVVGLVLLFGAAGLSIWRLVSTGSAADPAGIAAPALGLLAGSVLVLAAVGAAARLVDVASSRWRALGPALAVRRLARRLPVLATVVLLVAIAAASTAFASAFGATGERIASDVRELRVGGDLLVSEWPVDADPDALPATGSAALLRTPGEFGGDEPLILLATADRLPDALRALPDLVDPAALAATLASSPSALVLPEGTTRLEVATTATDGVVLRLWVIDPVGRVRSVPLDGAPIEGPLAAVAALDADVSRAVGDISARVTSITATTDAGAVEVPVPVGWEPQFEAFPDFFSEANPFGPEVRFAAAVDGLGFDLGRSSRDQVAVRLMPPGAAGARLPVVVTAAFAARNGLGDGEEIDVRFAGTGRYVLGTVAATVAALPTAGDRDAVLVDLPAFAVQQLRLAETVPAAPELVVRAADAEAVRAALPAGAGAVGLDPDTGDRMLGIARALLWLAAAGSVVVAAVGVAGVSASLVAERRRETRILAVLGELPARQARGQRLELALTISLSGLGGLAVGIALAVAVVPAFARAAAPGSGVLPSVALHLDVVGGLGLLAAFVAALVAVVVVHGVRVGRSAATPREAS